MTADGDEGSVIGHGDLMGGGESGDVLEVCGGTQLSGGGDMQLSGGGDMQLSGGGDTECDCSRSVEVCGGGDEMLEKAKKKKRSCRARREDASEMTQKPRREAKRTERRKSSEGAKIDEAQVRGKKRRGRRCEGEEQNEGDCSNAQTEPQSHGELGAAESAEGDETKKERRKERRAQGEGRSKATNSLMRRKRAKLPPRPACAAEAEGKETIWKIVKRNVRPEEKPAAVEGKATGSTTGSPPAIGGELDFLGLGGGAASSFDAVFGVDGNLGGGGNDLFGNLFAGGGTTSQGRQDASPGVPTLSMSADGSLSFDQTMFGGGPSTEGADFESFLEGRQMVNENFQEGVRLQPFAGAYRNKKGYRWTKEEDKEFYRALRKCGSDLMMIRALLPQFTDRQIHSKFKIEEKRNPEKVNVALTVKRRPLTIRSYEKHHGRIDASSHYRVEEDEALVSEDELPPLGDGESTTAGASSTTSRSLHDGGGAGRTSAPFGDVFDDSEGFLSSLCGGGADSMLGGMPSAIGRNEFGQLDILSFDDV